MTKSLEELTKTHQKAAEDKSKLEKSHLDEVEKLSNENCDLQKYIIKLKQDNHAVTAEAVDKQDQMIKLEVELSNSS